MSPKTKIGSPFSIAEPPPGCGRCLDEAARFVRNDVKGELLFQSRVRHAGNGPELPGSDLVRIEADTPDVVTVVEGGHDRRFCRRERSDRRRDAHRQTGRRRYAPRGTKIRRRFGAGPFRCSVPLHFLRRSRVSRGFEMMRGASGKARRCLPAVAVMVRPARSHLPIAYFPWSDSMALENYSRDGYDAFTQSSRQHTATFQLWRT